MIHKVHFYYGNRLRAFHAGLGVIVRALGHSIKSKIIFLDDSYSWIENMISSEEIPIKILSIDNHHIVQEFLLKEINKIEKTILLIANIDLIVQHQVLKMNELIHVLSRKKEQNEIILTSEKNYNEFEKFADYVSSISVRKM